MKTPQKFVIAVLVAMGLGMIAGKSPVLQAQQAASQPLPAPVQAPAPVTINPAPMQYRVIDIGLIPVAKGRTPAGTLEAVLNEMGGQGWRAVATSGSFVIMMQ